MHVSLVVTVLVFWEQQKSQLCTIIKYIPFCIKRLEGCMVLSVALGGGTSESTTPACVTEVVFC